MATAKSRKFRLLADPHAAFTLAFVGGAVDALGWFGLFQIFTGSVTGNVVIGAASVIPSVTGWAPRLIITAVFVVSAAVGRVAAIAAPGRETARALPLLLCGEVVTLAVAWAVGVALSSSMTHIDAPAVSIVGALLAFGMGLQNAAVNECLAGFPATTVVTSSLAKSGAAIADLAIHSFARGTDAGVRLRALAVLVSPIAGFAAGACSGAVLQYRIGFHSLFLPVAVLLLLVVDSARAIAATPAPAAAAPAAPPLEVMPVAQEVLLLKEAQRET